MDIVFHAHHTVISDALRARAERVVHKVAARLHRTVGATVRFEADGPTKRVEIVLHAPTQRPLIAAGEGRMFAPALAAAAAHLQAQVAKSDMPRVRARRTATAMPITGTVEEQVVDAPDEGDDNEEIAEAEVAEADVAGPVALDPTHTGGGGTVPHAPPPTLSGSSDDRTTSR